MSKSKPIYEDHFILAIKHVPMITINQLRKAFAIQEKNESVSNAPPKKFR